MTQYYLLNLNGNLLLLSDEEMKEGDLFYHRLTGKIEKIIHYHGRITHPYDKILAGHSTLPQIKFASQEIEDEYCKISGWVNVDKLGRKYLNSIYYKNIHNPKIYDEYNAFVDGFQAAIQLKQFSEEDIVRGIELARRSYWGDESSNPIVFSLNSNEIIQQLKQPRLIKVELEMEESFAVSGGLRPMGEIGGKRPESMFYSNPKLKSNAYTVTKII